MHWFNMSGQLKANLEEVNKDILTQAIRNGLDSTNLLIDLKDIQNVIKHLFSKETSRTNERAARKSS